MICIYETNEGKDTFPNADLSKDMIATPTFNQEAKGVTSEMKLVKCARLFLRSTSTAVLSKLRTTIEDIRSMM